MPLFSVYPGTGTKNTPSEHTVVGFEVTRAQAMVLLAAGTSVIEVDEYWTAERICVFRPCERESSGPSDTSWGRRK